MASPNLPDDVQSRITDASDLLTACIPIANLHTVPIFDASDKGIRRVAKPFGSGVLVCIGQRHYLLTAGHVYDAIVAGTNDVSIPRLDGGRGVRLKPSQGFTNCLDPSETRKNDFIDMAALELSDEHAALLGRERFLPEVAFELSDSMSYGSKYMLYGFPGSSSRAKFFNNTARVKAFQYGTSIYRMERGAIPNFDPEWEMLVTLARGANLSPTFNRVGIPFPQGLSGSGLWRMYSADVPRNTWKSSDLRLVGIVHSYHPDFEVVRATHIEHFSDMIRTCKEKGA